MLRHPPTPEIHRAYGGSVDTRPAPTRRWAETWVARLEAEPEGHVIECGVAVAGQVRLHSISQADRAAQLAIGLLSPADLGRGIGRQAIGLMLDRGFGPLGLHRVGLKVLAFNARAIACYRACGFVEEGRLRQSAWIDGEWHDDVLMGLLTTERES